MRQKRKYKFKNLLFVREKIAPEGFMDREMSSFFNPQIVQDSLEKNPFSKLSDIVKDIIEEAIVKMYIQPGGKINMTAIAEALNLSRAPVREALNALTKEGLVVVKPNVNGYFALDINDKYMADFFAARSAVEVSATKICAAKFHSIDRAHLKDCCDIFRKCYKTKNYSAFVEADRDFHNSLISYTKNNFLIDMYAGLTRTMEHYSSLSLFYLKHYGCNDIFNDFELMINEHIAIYNAINLGFVEGAGQLAQKHLDTCYSSFVHYYFSQGLR